MHSLQLDMLQFKEYVEISMKVEMSVKPRVTILNHCDSLCACVNIMVADRPHSILPFGEIQSHTCRDHHLVANQESCNILNLFFEGLFFPPGKALLGLLL